MKICKVILQNKILFSNAKIVESFWGKLLGLMFRKNYDSSKNGALIFKSANWIHSMFVFFNFNALYLDKDYNVVEHHRDIRPFRILPPVWSADYVIEYTGEPIEVSPNSEVKIELICE